MNDLNLDLGVGVHLAARAMVASFATAWAVGFLPSLAKEWVWTRTLSGFIAALLGLALAWVVFVGLVARPRQPGGGWGWVILLGIGVIPSLVLAVGLLYAISVGEGGGSICNLAPSRPVSLVSGVLLLLGLLGGWWYSRD